MTMNFMYRKSNSFHSRAHSWVDPGVVGKSASVSPIYDLDHAGGLEELNSRMIESSISCDS